MKKDQATVEIINTEKSDFDLLKIISSVSLREIEETKTQVRVKFSEGSTGGMNMIAFD